MARTVSFLVESDTWLAEQLGRSAFRVSVCRHAEGEHGVVSALGAGLPAFCYAKVPTLEVEDLAALSGQGFFVSDVNVTLSRKPGGQKKGACSAHVQVRDGEERDRALVLDIAEQCFIYSRFHLDPFMENDVANKIKRSWMESYFSKTRGERVLIAEIDDKPVGFLAVLAGSKEGQSTRTIDLIGVDPGYQGQGVGKELVQTFVGLYEGQCDLLTVGTQVANVPSLRLYERGGFSITESTYVLHAHVER